MRRLGFLATIVSVLLHAQESCPIADIKPSFRNLDFTEGDRGSVPPGWNPNPPECYRSPHGAYVIETASGAACKDGQRCGVIKSIRDGSSDKLWFLFQLVDAEQYRGKMLTFRAAVRTDVSLGSAARLLVRIHRTNGDTSFRDDMGNNPVTFPVWSFYELEAPIATDARDIEIGMQLVGQGAAWIDNISVTFADSKK
jgi:hypothetical protein